MRCEACANRAKNPISGVFYLDCLTCCAHLVISARHVPRQQESMLQLIESGREYPQRAEVLQEVERIDAERAGNG